MAKLGESRTWFLSALISLFRKLSRKRRPPPLRIGPPPPGFLRSCKKRVCAHAASSNRLRGPCSVQPGSLRLESLWFFCWCSRKARTWLSSHTRSTSSLWRTAARTASISRADSRPSARIPSLPAPLVRLVAMTIRWGRSPAVRPAWPTKFRRSTWALPLQKKILVHVSPDSRSRFILTHGTMARGGVERGGEYGEYGGGIPHDHYMRTAGSDPAGLVSTCGTSSRQLMYLPPLATLLGRSWRLPWVGSSSILIARSTGSETPSPK